MSTVIYKDDDAWLNRVDDYVAESKEEAVRHMNKIIQGMNPNTLALIASIMHPRYEADVKIYKVSDDRRIVLLTIGNEVVDSIIRSVTVRTEFEYKTDVDFLHWTETVQSAYSALMQARGF